MKRLLLSLALLLTLGAGCASAQVVFNAKGTADCTANAQTSLTCATHTVGSGTNRVLIVSLVLSTTTTSGESCHWDSTGTNQLMTAITGATRSSAGVNARVLLFGLVAPTSGAKTLACAWTGSSDYTVMSLDYTGANQTGGVTSFPNGACATGNSASASLAVTSATNNQTVAAVGHNNSITTTSTQTQLFLDNSPANVSGAASRETSAGGAASVTHTWAVTSAQWVVCGTDIAAASGGGGCTAPPNQLMMLGVGNCNGAEDRR